MSNKEAIITIIEMAVAGLNSDETLEVADKMYNFGRTFPGIAREFCSQYGLGEWFEEALLKHDIDVVGEIELIADCKKLTESSNWEMRQAGEEAITQAALRA